MRKSGEIQNPQSFRSGPVTANRNITCANCGTNTTVLWRKGPDGQSPLCNPCGLFYKLHGTHRSPEKKKEIHRRNRNGKKRCSISTLNSWSSTEEGEEEVESPGGMEGQEYGKSEDKEYPVPSSTSEYLAHGQYEYQWRRESVH